MRLKFRFGTLICLLVPPCKFKNWLLRFFGWRVATNCSVGFSWLNANYVDLREFSRIGHGNIVNVEAVVLRSHAYINHLNRVTGPFLVVLCERAGVGNQNKVIRAPRGVSWGKAIFKLGKWSKVTTGHIIDCTRSVIFGEHSTLAGRGSQIWTHGYLHAPRGLERFRIDGSVRVGNNVYIGSACVFNAGVGVADAITVGAASCISRSIDRPGLYVSQPLRFVELDYRLAMERYPKVRSKDLVEKVVNKRISHGS